MVGRDYCMYYLIYDHYLSDKKHQRDIAHLETHLTDVGIPFKTGKLSPLKSLADLVQLAQQHNAHTIVAVGGDEIMGSVLNIVARKEDITLGVVPMGQDSLIADFLGIPKGRGAFEILSARKIERLDLGTVNDQFFLISLEAEESDGVRLAFNSSYRLKSMTEDALVGVYNYNVRLPLEIQKTDPQDGWLNAMVIPKKKARFALGRGGGTPAFGAESSIPTKRVTIESARGNAAVIADNSRIYKTPLTVGIVAKALKVIVGKDRLF